MSTEHDLRGTGPLPRITVPAPRGRHAQSAVPAPTARWERRYVAAVAAADLLLITLAVTIPVVLALDEDAAVLQGQVASSLLAALLLVLGLATARAWDGRVIGSGTQEFRRVYRAVLSAAMLLALGGLALEITSVRSWVFIVVPLCGVAITAARYLLRKTLHRRRTSGRCLLPVLAVGSTDQVADLIARTRNDPHFGWSVTGACTPTGTGAADGTVDGVPVLGDLDSVGRVALDGRYRVVAVTPAPGWGPKRLHRLAWELEGSRADLAVDPGLMEIAGPRLHITPVDGLPLLRLTQPRFTGTSRLLKGAFDRLVAALLIVLLAPLLFAIAVAVCADGGPAFYRQERVGAGGRLFRMTKFRSMVVGADRQVSSLAAGNEAAGPLFKMRHDPRVTRIGRTLRRYSLDELPQLFDVLRGSMSLVGPRPPLQSEVDTYGPDARRRLLVRPGMTGLWQVSGRSDLSWEQTVRLDLRYVENWSIALDAAILWKTIGAVVRSRGAY